MPSAGSGREFLEDRLEAVEGVVVDLVEEGVLVPGELVCGTQLPDVTAPDGELAVWDAGGGRPSSSYRIGFSDAVLGRPGRLTSGRPTSSPSIC